MVDPTPDPTLARTLALANRILYQQGVVDGLGHVSARHPQQPDWFMLSCNRAPGLVRPEDIVTYDLDGNAVSAEPGRPYLERFCSRRRWGWARSPTSRHERPTWLRRPTTRRSSARGTCGVARSRPTFD
jgi:hypothetical protein